MNGDAHKKEKSAPYSGKVFDVRRPGMASVPPTSKPVIVGHKPQVRDPVIMNAVKRDMSRAVPASQKAGVVPPVKLEPTPEHEDAAQLAPPTQISDSDPNTLPEQKSLPPTESTSASPVLEQTPTSLPIEYTEPAKESTLSPEAMKEDEHSYTVDPKSVVIYKDPRSASRAKIVWWVVAILIVIGAIGDVLLDAGYITTTMPIPHTHLIK